MADELDGSAWERLIARYCDAWNEPDPVRRRDVLGRVWEETGTYTDPNVHLSGREALVDYIGVVLERYPGSRITGTSRVDAHHGLARFAWRRILADGTPLPEGLDVAEVTSDGKLSRMIGFFGAL